MANDDFYKSAQWKKMRFRVIHTSTHCGLCHALLDKKGKNKIHIDHIVKRADNPALALVRSNVWALCTTCHMSTKRKLEYGAQINHRIGIDGWRADGGES